MRTRSEARHHGGLQDESRKAARRDFLANSTASGAKGMDLNRATRLPQPAMRRRTDPIGVELRAAQRENRRLKAELEEKTTEIELLHEVATGVAAAPTMEAMLAFIAEIAVRVTRTDSSSIYICDPQTRVLTLLAVHDAPKGVLGKLKLQVGEGITGWVARELQPVVLERDAYLDPRFKELPDLRDQRFQSFVSVPMIAKNQVIGVLNVKTRRPHHYPPQQIRLLCAIAAQAAASIEGARLQQSMRARETQISAISEVSKTITSNLYLEEILQLIVAMTAQTLNFRICSIMLLDEDKQELVIKATQSKSRDYVTKPNLKVGESVAGRALQERQVLTIRDVKQTPEYRFPDIAEKEGLCSMICIPLLVRDKAIGVLNCYTGRPHVFTPEEIDLLVAVANQAGIAIENAKLVVRSAIIQEMHHRVKNSLQTVASLLRLQMHSRHSLSVEDVLSECVNRIVSIAAVHEMLAMEELDEVSLKRVAEKIVTLTTRSLLRPNHRVRATVEGEDVLLPSHRATRVALILNELLQNAIRHGIQNRRTGTLRVSLRTVDGQVELEVANDGTPLPHSFDPRATSSLGLRIVETLTREELGGRFTLEGEEWTRARIAFPR
ncbi:MAG: GAF domain-containing protein [Armatimonadetes bacterium]|nr:GAF domain-containing protein [Armatimonadota bacterium]